MLIGNNYIHLFSVGGDNLLKVWKYNWEQEEGANNLLQICKGHVNKINTVCFIDEKRILTSGGFEGIYEWKYNGDNSIEGERVIDVSKLKPIPQQGVGHKAVAEIPKPV